MPYSYAYSPSQYVRTKQTVKDHRKQCKHGWSDFRHNSDLSNGKWQIVSPIEGFSRQTEHGSSMLLDCQKQEIMEK